MNSLWKTGQEGVTELVRLPSDLLFLLQTFLLNKLSNPVFSVFVFKTVWIYWLAHVLVARLSFAYSSAVKSPDFLSLGSYILIINWVSLFHRLLWLCRPSNDLFSHG